MGQYIRRKYSDVKGTFDFTLTYKNIFKTYEMYGVNSLGLWLWTQLNSKPLGFFEWDWIKEILVSEKKECIFIVMKDMDQIIENVALCPWEFKIFCVCDISNGEKAIGLSMNVDINRVVSYIIQADYVPVISVE